MAAQKTPFPRFGGRKLHLRLKPGPQAAGEGRHALDQLGDSLNDDQLNELRLLVSELLTNSVRHGAKSGDWITLEVEVQGDSVRAVVTDKGPGFALDGKPHPHKDRPGGWGLCLIDQIADRWGVETSGKTSVWFEVALDGRLAAV